MAKPKAVIHIGFNKCGSTAIQKWLGDAGPSLKDHGICYTRTDPRPDVICNNPQMLVLGYTLANQTLPLMPINSALGISDSNRKQQDDVANKYKKLVEEFAANEKCSQFIASSEFLVSHHITREAIDGLHTWLSKTFDEVSYLAYIRSPEAWFVSLYGHEIRSGQTTEALDAFVQRIQVAPFGELLRRWSSVVGQKALNVRLFDETWLKNDGLIDDFKLQLGVHEAINGIKSRRVNTTWKPETSGKWLKSLLNRNLKTLPPRPQINPKISRALLDHNASDLEWIRGTFFKDLNRPLFDRGPAS